MKAIFTLIGIAIAGISFSQYPEINSWMLNTTGELGDYEYFPGPPPNTTAVNMTDSVDVLTVCFDDNYVYIRANGLANYTMGPWAMNPNQPSAHLSTYRFSRNPQEETGTKEGQPLQGALGVAVNGVKIYGISDDRSYNSVSGQNDPNGDGIWHSDAWVSEGATMDATGAGHPDQQGNYHYHATPIALYTDPSTAHSPIIGYAFDGFPIYGPFGYTDSLNPGAVTRMVSSYQLRSMSDRSTLPDGSTSVPAGPAINATFPLGTYWEDYEYVAGLGTLDEFNGRYCVTPEYPGGTYAYFITTDGAGDPIFPYIIGLEYYGQVNANEIGGASGNITIPSGVSCDPAQASVEEAELAFELFPNPANSTLNITGVNGVNYQIVDQLGRNIAFGVIDNFIDIESLENGVYFLIIEKDNITSTARFIKE